MPILKDNYTAKLEIAEHESMSGKTSKKYYLVIEENDEWEDIEEIELMIGGDCKTRFNSQNGVSYEFPQKIADKINQLIKNQKYLKERLDKNE